MSAWGQPPGWLEEAVVAVMADLQGAVPIAGLVAAAALVDGMDGVSLAVIEPGRSTGPLPRLPEADELEPEPAEIPGGGNFVPRGLAGPGLVAWVAEVLQEDLAETDVAWRQARPPCPHHPHPARPVVRDGEAWWICERLSEPLYRIGQGEVPHGAAPHRPGRLKPTGRASVSTSSDLPPPRNALSGPPSKTLGAQSDVSGRNAERTLCRPSACL